MTGSVSSLQTDLGARLARPGNRLSRTSPAVRRGLVAVAAGGAVAAIALPFLLPQPWLPVATAGLLVLLVAGALLDVSTRMVLQLPAAVLDERTRSRREHAAFVATRISTPLLMLAVVAVGISAGRAGGWSVTVEQVLPAATALAFTVAGLPLWVLAWTEPAWADDDEVVAASTPAGPFPWVRVAGQGVYFAAALTVLMLLGFGGTTTDPASVLPAGLLAGAIFTLLMGLTTAWARRRL